MTGYSSNLSSPRPNFTHKAEGPKAAVVLQPCVVAESYCNTAFGFCTCCYQYDASRLLYLTWLGHFANNLANGAGEVTALQLQIHHFSEMDFSWSESLLFSGTCSTRRWSFECMVSCETFASAHTQQPATTCTGGTNRCSRHVAHQER